MNAHESVMREIAQGAANASGRPIHLYRYPGGGYSVLRNHDEDYVQSCNGVLVETFKPERVLRK